MNQGNVGSAGRTFAVALREGRQALSLTQRALAQKLSELGVSIDQASIARMESGQREPRLSEAVAISELLQFDVLQLEYEHPNVSYYGAMQQATQKFFEARSALAEYLNSAKHVATQYKLWELQDPSSDDDGEFLEHSQRLPGHEKAHGASPVDWRELDWDWCLPYLSGIFDGLAPSSVRFDLRGRDDR